MDINTEVKGAAAFAPINALPVERMAALRAEIAHHIPGRLRLRSALLKENHGLADQAARRFAEIQGITSATANPNSGSLLLSYDPAVITPGKLVELLTNQGHIGAPGSTRSDPDGAWTDKLAGVISGWLIDAVAERLALAVIGALI
jgi:hypothetical protein